MNYLTTNITNYPIINSSTVTATSDFVREAGNITSKKQGDVDVHGIFRTLWVKCLL